MTGHEPPIPDEEWRKFLADNEHAIRRTAPREPSAQERAGATPGQDQAVGEVWTQKDQEPVRPWRELSTGERSRHGARLLGSLVARVVFLVVVGRDQPESPLPGERPAGVVLEESGATRP
ncbi:hypothetical protein ACIRL3_18825 [Streptomyces sp. NPDC102384]|uniref:hypothetical protein n=1 Tax=Streptomyces sp. NPDC102384 TaxID=3366166 RepID=UPI00382A9980